MVSFSVNCGMHTVGKIRAFLEECKFIGLDIEYMESKYLLESDFIIKGTEEDVLRIKTSIENFKRENGIITINIIFEPLVDNETIFICM